MKAAPKFIVFAFVALAGVWLLQDRLYPPEEAGIRAVTHDANDMVVTDASKIANKMASPAGQAYKKQDGPALIEDWQKSREPLADEVATARAARAAELSRARGEYVPAVPHTLIANDVRWSGDDVLGWVDAHTPVNPTTCVLFEASGTARIGFRKDPPATPDGMNPETRTDDSKHLDKYKHLFFPEAWWGAIIGKVCDSDDLSNCSSPFLVGSHKALGGPSSPTGKLWIRFNTYTTPGDAADYRGGYDFGHHDVPMEMCKGRR